MTTRLPHLTSLPPLSAWHLHWVAGVILENLVNPGYHFGQPLSAWHLHWAIWLVQVIISANP
jgi:hypothetical protein